MRSVGQAKPFSRAALRSHLRTPLYRNGYLLMLSSIAMSGIGMVYWVLAARLYTPEAVGLNSAVISAMVFVAGVSHLELGSALVRFVPRAGRATRRFVGYAYLATVIMTAAACVVAVLGLGARFPVLGTLGGDFSWGVWFIVATVAWSVFGLQDDVLTGLRRTAWVPVENSVFALAKIALLLLLAGWLPRYGIFAAWTLPVVVAILPVNYLIFRYLIPRHAQSTRDQELRIIPKQIVRYSVGNYLGTLFSVGSTALLPIMVTYLAGPSANAYFYLAWLIANAFQMVSLNMALSLTVEAATDETKLGIYSYKAFVQIARIVVPLVAVVLLGAPYILRIFGPAYAAEGTTLLRLLALAAIPNIINALYLSIARVRQRMTMIVMIQGSLCVLMLGLGYVLLPVDGITGLGYASVAGQTVVAGVLVVTQLRPASLIGALRSVASLAKEPDRAVFQPGGESGEQPDGPVRP